MLGWHICGTVNHDNEIGGVSSGVKCTSSFRCFVQWTLIIIRITFQVSLRVEQDDRRSRVLLTWLLILQEKSIVVNMPTFHVEPIHIHSIFIRVLQFLHFSTGLPVKSKTQFIDGDLILPGVGLEGSSEESLWEEECRQPECLRFTLLQPASDKQHSFLQIIYPCSQWFQ